MPIYAFACQACGHAFDSLQRMSDPDPAECPECGEAQIKRQLTAPSFRLSGSGWYETDFKKDGDRKRNIAGDGGEAKSADAASASKDSSQTKETAGKGDVSGKTDSPSAPAKGNDAGGSSGKALAAPAASPAKPSAPAT